MVLASALATYESNSPKGDGLYPFETIFRLDSSKYAAN